VALAKVAEDPRHPLMVSAAKLLLSYTLGKPAETLRLESEERSFTSILVSIVESPSYRAALARRDAIEATAIEEPKGEGN